MHCQGIKYLFWLFEDKAWFIDFFTGLNHSKIRPTKFFVSIHSDLNFTFFIFDLKSEIKINQKALAKTDAVVGWVNILERLQRCGWIL